MEETFTLNYRGFSGHTRIGIHETKNRDLLMIVYNYYDYN